MIRLTALATTAVVACLYAAPAQAQATRTWVSGVGDDANPCSRTAPCKTFAGAISKTAPAGEINCLDPGGFGGVTITKSLSIVCDYTEGGVLSAGAGVNGVVINAGVNDIVVLSGIDFNGAGNAQNGIRFIAGAALHVRNVKIVGYRASNGNGISFAPTGTSELYVSDSFIAGNGTSTTSGGIVVEPTGAGAARVSLNRNQIENNTVGIRIGGTASTGGIRALIRDNVISGNTNNGVLSSASTAATFVHLERNTIFANNTGIQSDGANSFMQINGNTITLSLGAGMSATASGTLQSYVNNFINFNSGGDGATAGANLAPK